MKETWDYRNFDLLIAPAGGGYLVVHERVSEPLSLPLPADALLGQAHWLLPDDALPFRAIPVPDPRFESPEALGAALFQALFPPRIHRRFEEALRDVEDRPRQGLRLRLHFELDQPGRAPVAALPWELLYDPDRRRFLQHGLAVPLVRCLSVPQVPAPTPRRPPLRIVAVLSEPVGQIPFGADRLRNVLREEWGAHAEVHVVPDPERGLFASLPTVTRLLRDTDAHVLHLAGHGTLDPDIGEGRFLFTAPDGHAQPVAASTLAIQLRDLDALQVVVAGACHSGEVPGLPTADPFGSLATALVREGVPAVVAMQWPIRTDAALAFSHAFYHSLALMRGIEEAVADGRRAIHQDDDLKERKGYIQWATPALYLRENRGRVLGEVIARSEPAPAIRRHVRDVSALVADRTASFVGRGFLFAAVDRMVEEGRDRDRGRYFLLEAEPGVGKTTFLAELVRRHGWVHHFNQRQEGIHRPEAFLLNACAQLIARYDLPYRDLPTRADRDGGFFQELLHQAAGRLPDGESLVFLVDALDEADDDGLPAGVNPLFLPRQLPARVLGVLSQRPLDPENAGTSFLAGELRSHHLDPRSPENRADAREYVTRRLEQPSARRFLDRCAVSPGALSEALGEKSDGNFMYLRHVLDEICTGDYVACDLAALPRGLTGYYAHHWARMKARAGSRTSWDDALRVLGALMVSPRPASAGLLTLYADIGQRGLVREVLRDWRQFLRVTPALDDDGRPSRRYSIYHATFHEYLTGRDDVADMVKEISRDDRDVLDGAGRRRFEALLEDPDEPSFDEPTTPGVP
jgi:hypothetical protein